EIDGIGIILAPLFVPFLVGDPQTILFVAHETVAGFKTRGAGDYISANVAAGNLGDLDVVVAFLIGIVADVDLAGGIGSDGGIPVIDWRLSHFNFPLRQVYACLIIAERQLAGQDLEAALAPGLPGQPDLARRRSGGNDVVVGAGIAGQPHDGGPFTL